MKKHSVDNIRLGAFVIIGLLVLVVSLYMIGINRNFFGTDFFLRARFRNVSGLMSGNNVRFAGIQCGTVKSIDLINDTTVEVTMLIRKKTSVHISRNATASIGSEGLMGNKVIDINPVPTMFSPVSNGDILQPGDDLGISGLLSDFSATGGNAHYISSDLRQTADRINRSPVLNELLTDTTLVKDLRETIRNFRHTSLQLKGAASDAACIINRVHNGNGALGALLTDSYTEESMMVFVERMRAAAEYAETLAGTLDSVARELHTNIQQPGGLGYLLLRDSMTTVRISNSLQSIESGTKAFNEDMEALKHNFLLRGYFKKQQRKLRN